MLDRGSQFHTALGEIGRENWNDRPIELLRAFPVRETEVTKKAQNLEKILQNYKGLNSCG